MEHVKNIDGEWFVSKEIAATFCNAEPATFDTWRRKGDGKEPPFDNKLKRAPVRELGHWCRDVQVNKSLGRKPRNKESEELRHKRLQADKIEMSLMVQSKELVHAEDVTNAWAEMLTLVKTRLLKIPTSLAPRIHGEKDVYEIQKRLEDAVKEALEELCNEISV